MRALRAGRLLFAKDLRVLGRSRGLVAVLIGYPIVIAILLAIALSGGDRRPAVAFVNLDAASGRTVQVGDERLSIEDYATRLEDDVDLVRLGPAQAREALEDGRVSAVLTVPRGFIADLQSGLRPPVLRLATNPRSPIEAQAIERNLDSAVYRLNQALATAYVTQVLDLVDLIQDGGTVGIFGRSGTLLGLAQSDRELVLMVSRAVQGMNPFDLIGVLGIAAAACYRANGDPRRASLMAVNDRDFDESGGFRNYRDIDCTGSVCGALAGALAPGGIDDFPVDWVGSAISANREVYGFDIEANAQHMVEVVASVTA